MTITRGIIPSAVKTLIYGAEGIGKTTLASKFPDPVFIDTEGSTKRLDVARLPTPESWDQIINEVKYVYQHPECCKTLVIDTADWAEILCIKNLFGDMGIESPGYGKGYVMLAEKFQDLLTELEKVIVAGIHVVMTAHAQMRKFEQPDEAGSYDRWEMKLQNSPKANISAMVKEWADIVLFVNYKTIVSDKDKQGKGKAQGGRRVMYTEHHPCWDAKNRYGLPAMMDFSYEGIRPIIEGQGAPAPMPAPSLLSASIVPPVMVTVPAGAVEAYQACPMPAPVSLLALIRPPLIVTSQEPLR